MAKIMCAHDAGGLIIKINPRSNDVWIGNREQLIDAGVIPRDITWPKRTECTYFTHDGIYCSLKRKRQPGKAQWVDIDHWRLIRYCADRGNGGPELYEKKQEIERIKWVHSPAGQRIFHRARNARQDPAYEAFRRLVLPSTT